MEDKSKKLSVIALIFALIAVSASAEQIQGYLYNITCVNCTLDNPTFVNYTFPGGNGANITNDLNMNGYNIVNTSNIEAVTNNELVVRANISGIYSMITLSDQAIDLYVGNLSNDNDVYINPDYTQFFKTTKHDYLSANMNVCTNATRYLVSCVVTNGTNGVNGSNGANGTVDYSLVYYKNETYNKSEINNSLNEKVNKTGGEYMVGTLNLDGDLRIANPHVIYGTTIQSILYGIGDYISRLDLTDTMFKFGITDTISGFETQINITNGSIKIQGYEGLNLTQDFNSKVNKSGDTISGIINFTTPWRYTTGGINRTQLYESGIQDWELYSGVTKVGKIAYALPGNLVGITMFNATDTRRVSIAQLATGVCLAASNISTGNCGNGLIVHTQNEGNNVSIAGNLYLRNAGKGFQTRSPDGSVWCTTTSNAGVNVVNSGVCT